MEGKKEGQREIEVERGRVPFKSREKWFFDICFQETTSLTCSCKGQRLQDHSIVCFLINSVSENGSCGEY